MRLLAFLPYRILLQIIQTPQRLNEHVGGWLLIVIGVRLFWIFQFHGAVAPGSVEMAHVLEAIFPVFWWSLIFVFVGTWKIVAAVVTPPDRRSKIPLVGAVVWLFFSLLFFLDDAASPMLASVFPILCISSTLSYWSNKPAERREN